MACCHCSTRWIVWTLIAGLVSAAWMATAEPAHAAAKKVLSVEGITELRSISGVGSSFVIVQFDLSRKVNEALEDVRNRISVMGSELPRDASEDFSRVLKDYIPAIVAADLSAPFADLHLPPPIKRAVIVHQGELTPNYAHLQRHLEQK